MASLGKRLIDLARANLNALLEKVETSVDELTDEELEAELERRRARRRREEDERKLRESAEEAARARATQRGQTPRASAPRAAPRTSPPPRRPSPLPSKEKRLRELYSQLEVPYGADFEEVKKSFRRLMRKYHPDLHVGNPAKHKAATQLTMSLTVAYNELEAHLKGSRSR
jgi:DnaJ-domain-containing protein 1